MLERWKLRSRNRRRNREIVDDLYAGIVEASRDPVLFTGCGVADTVMGRFESLSLQMFLMLRRCGGEAALKALAQDLVDRFMLDIEDSIRELGIGDVSVPKRMRKLAGMFYERVAAYDAPLGARDAPGLAAALGRFALADGAAAGRAEALAVYVTGRDAAYAAVPTAAILQGRLDEAGA